MKLPPSILRYWEAMNAKAFDSAVAAMVVYGGAATGHQAAQELGSSIPALSLQQLGMAFLSVFGWGLITYLHDHPLSNLLPPDHPDNLARINQELSQK